MSFNDGKGLIVAGSAGIRSQQYAGDYDGFQIVRLSEKTDLAAAKEIVRQWQENIKKIQALEDVYIGDIKCGAVGEEPIRWTPAQVLAGKKRHAGKMLPMAAALLMPGMAKMDAIAMVASRFTDFSVVYEFHNKGKALNPIQEDVMKSLLKDIAEFNKEGNYFKVLKRLYSIARYENDTDTVKELTTVLNSDLGRLYHIIGDMRTLVELLQRPRVPLKEIRSEIDQFVSRLSGIYTLSDYLKDEKDIVHRIHALLKVKKAKMAKGLTELADQLDGYLQYATKHIAKIPAHLKGGVNFGETLRYITAAAGPAVALGTLAYVSGIGAALPAGLVGATLGMMTQATRDVMSRRMTGELEEEPAEAPTMVANPIHTPAATAAAPAPAPVVIPVAPSPAGAAYDPRHARVSGILRTTPAHVQPTEDVGIVMNPLHRGRGRRRVRDKILLV